MEKFTTIAELFADRSRWTQGEYARNGQGLAVPSQSADAVCFCLIGGITKVYGGPFIYTDTETKPNLEYLEAVRKLRLELNGKKAQAASALIQRDDLDNFASFNDNCPYEEVFETVKAAGI